MKAIAVGDIKTCFSEILEEITQGEKVGILYGETKMPVAMIVPYIEEKKAERKIGILEGKINIEFSDDFEMTVEELLDLQFEFHATFFKIICS